MSNQTDQGRTTKSIEYCTQALAIAREKGDRVSEGDLLGDLGRAYYAQGQVEKSIEVNEQALAIAREIGNRQNESKWLSNLGTSYRALGQVEKAVEMYEQALAISREIGDRQGEGVDAGNLGTSYRALGQVEKAVEMYEQALIVARELGNRQNESKWLGKLGDAYRAKGQSEKAIEMYEQALVIAREIGDRRSQGVWLGKMATTYGDLEQIWPAVELYEEALAIAREMGDRRSEGTLLGSLGVDLFNQRQANKSVEFLTQALAIARELGNRQNEGLWLGNMANAYNALGQKEKAIEVYQQAVAIAREVGDRYHEGLWQSNMGVVYCNLGQPEKAVQVCNQALAIAREIGNRQLESLSRGNLDRPLRDLAQMKKIDVRERRRNEGKSLGLLAMAYQAQGQLEKAIGNYEQALAIARELGDGKTEGNLQAALDRAEKALGEIGESAPVAAPPKVEPAPAPQREAPVESKPEPFAITSPIHLELIRIPSGEFLMGSISEEYKHRRERPQHLLHVPEFCIGKYPVTNAQYAVFLQATGHKAPRYWKEGKVPAGKKNHPVTNVSWYDATAFCEWLAWETGNPFALPSEAEWEKAARGTDGRIYPWGDEFDKDKCNVSESRIRDTTPVGWYSPDSDSPYGCVDMAGNVYEWTRSLQKEYPYDPDDGREDQETGDARVFRGGCFSTNSDGARCAFRIDWRADELSWQTGFRVRCGALPISHRSDS